MCTLPYGIVANQRVIPINSPETGKEEVGGPVPSFSNYQLFNKGLVGLSTSRVGIGCFCGESVEAMLDGGICLDHLGSKKVTSLSQS